tara:strand:+ start:61 stop:336 length:276 start_codon:yes stop_codon:yes gene_type:complete
MDSVKSSNNYALSKIKSEKYIKKKFKNLSTKFYILRFFNLIGADYKNKIGLTDKPSKHIFTNLFKSYILKKVLLYLVITMKQLMVLSLEIT